MMTSVVAKPIEDGGLTVHIDPDATFEAPVYVGSPPDAKLDKSTPIAFTATDPRTGEHVTVGDHFFAP